MDRIVITHNILLLTIDAFIISGIILYVNYIYYMVDIWNDVIFKVDGNAW